MSDIRKLPDWIDPPKLAHAGALLEGRMSLQTMSILEDHIEGSTKELELLCRLKFSFKSKRIICEGQLEVELPLSCQRCLEVITCKINKNLRYYWLEVGEDDENIEPDYDALWLDEIPLKLAELLEEELVLSLPLIPKHDVCPDLGAEIAAYLAPIEDIEDKAKTDVVDKKPNPFAVLTQLK